MSRKKFFKKSGGQTLWGEMGKDMAPLLDKIRRPVESYATRHPYGCFWLLFSLVAANILVLALFTDAFKNKPVTSVYRTTPLSVTREELAGKVPANIGIGQFLELREIRDSIGALLAKRTLSTADTMAFLLLTQRLAAIDPSFRPLTLQNLVPDTLHKK